MKRKLLLLVMGIAGLFGCSKDENQIEKDQAKIREYLEENSIDAEFHEAGFYYTIEKPGGSQKPTISNQVRVRYKGYLLDGSVFDQTPDNDARTFSLSNLIPGWQIGIPLVGRGGSVTLYLPSAYGYGSRSTASIPGNSILIFEIDLVDFF